MVITYIEPDLIDVLTLSSYLLLLNTFRGVFQVFCKAGLLGELVIGAIYGASLTNILPTFFQQSVQQLGYLGLMLIIAEGGLDARLDILTQPRTFVVACAVGVTGIGVPIALTFLLLVLGFQYNYLEAFAIGASLSATSLGTTFALIAAGESTTSKKEGEAHQSLVNSHAGSVLIGAALLDDIVALVISSVISSLDGDAKQSLESWTIIRPILSSFLLISTTALVGSFVIKPIAVTIAGHFHTDTMSLSVFASFQQYITQLGTFMFIAVVAAFAIISHYIHSSMLIGCFCAGALMKYTWNVIDQRLCAERTDIRKPHPLSPASTFSIIYPVLHYVLQPCFFASIGAAIPVKSLFQRTTAWRGLCYAILMMLGKIVAGFWLLAPKIKSPKPNVFPALLVGLALVARGEIGFLIINIASENKLVSQEAVSVAIWAIVLNTFIGPICVGLFLKSLRIRQSVLQSEWGLVSE